MVQSKISHAYFHFNTRERNILNAQQKAMKARTGAVQHILSLLMLVGACVQALALLIQVIS